MAKTVVAAALALILGIFVGGIGPRAELGRARKELAEAQAAAARARGSALPLALGMGSLMRGADRTRGPAGGGGAGVPRFVTPPGGDGATGGGRRSTAELMAAGKAAAEVRAVQYRTAFAEAAQLPTAGLASMEQAIASMNVELGRAADQAARQLGEGRKPTPRDMADLGVRLLDIYRQADDRFKAGLDERGRSALTDTGFDLATQIDVGIFTRLAERLGPGADIQVEPPARSAP
jgi:hypothetical protein